MNPRYEKQSKFLGVCLSPSTLLCPHNWGPTGAVCSQAMIKIKFWSAEKTAGEKSPTETGPGLSAQETAAVLGAVLPGRASLLQYSEWVPARTSAPHPHPRACPTAWLPGNGLPLHEATGAECMGEGSWGESLSSRNESG